jgi:hypothetical protein
MCCLRKPTHSCNLGKEGTYGGSQHYAREIQYAGHSLTQLELTATEHYKQQTKAQAGNTYGGSVKEDLPRTPTAAHE